MTRSTEKQRAARERNHRIWRLRGLWSQLLLLTGSRRTSAQSLVDAELELLGAEPETVRRERGQRELRERLVNEGAHQ